MTRIAILLFIATISLNGTASNTPIVKELIINYSDCNPKWKVEGINDAKGEYTLGKETWTIQFEEEGFIAFHTINGTQGEADSIQEIVAISNCEFSIMMEGIQGEMVPTWTLIYNESGNYYDLHVHDYDAETDTWSDKVFEGSSDNG